MTAKEMFEALGWKRTRCDNAWIVFENDIRIIRFDKRENDITMLCDFDIEALAATKKQVEELGWIEGENNHFIIMARKSRCG